MVAHTRNINYEYAHQRSAVLRSVFNRNIRNIHQEAGVGLKVYHGAYYGSVYYGRVYFSKVYYGRGYYTSGNNTTGHTTEVSIL